MNFSVSKDGIEWSWGFGPDSVTLTVKDLDQEMTKISPEVPLAAWSLLLSQRQQFLNNHLAPVPVTPNQQGTHEMKDEENLTLLDEEEDKENSPPKTPVSEKPTRPPALLRSCPFRTKLENGTDFIFSSLFQ